MSSPGSVGQGTPAATNYREIHSFLKTEKIIWSAGSEESSGKSSHTSDGEAEFPFDVDVPREKQCKCPASSQGLPVSCNTSKGPAIPPYDTSAIEVAYALTITVQKTGFLQRDAKSVPNSNP